MRIKGRNQLCRINSLRPYYGQDYYAIRRGSWKLVHNYPFEPPQIYNFEDDPFEKIYFADQNRRVFGELINRPQTHIQLAGAVVWQESGQWLRKYGQLSLAEQCADY